MLVFWELEELMVLAWGQWESELVVLVLAWEQWEFELVLLVLAW